MNYPAEVFNYPRIFAGWIEKQIPISNKDGFFEIQYDMIDNLSFSE